MSPLICAGGTATPGCAPVSVDDTNCIQMEGDGCNAPITASLVIDPAVGNLATCGPAGLLVTAGANACACVLQVLDTPTLDLTLTGTGQPGDPWTISGVAIAPAAPIVVVDNAENISVVQAPAGTLTFDCVPVAVTAQTLTPNPAGCLSVAGDLCAGLTVSLGISDDVCNALECRADGLFAFGDDTVMPAIVRSCTIEGPFGPFNGNVPDTILYTNRCISLTNPSPCRTLGMFEDISGSVRISANSGQFTWFIDNSRDGGGTYSRRATDTIQLGIPWLFDMYFASPQPTFILLAPGQTLNFCYRFGVNGVGVVNGQIGNTQICIELMGVWQQ